VSRGTRSMTSLSSIEQTAEEGCLVAGDAAVEVGLRSSGHHQLVTLVEQDDPTMTEHVTGVQGGGQVLDGEQDLTLTSYQEQRVRLEATGFRAAKTCP